MASQGLTSDLRGHYGSPCRGHAHSGAGHRGSAPVPLYVFLHKKKAAFPERQPFFNLVCIDYNHCARRIPDQD